VPVYATADELAAALRVAVTVKNQADLERCVAASSEEIDQYCDLPAGELLPDPAPPLVASVCIARGVEWWKANDAAFGAVGFDGTGVLSAPADGFARHARNLITYKARFGVG
jgi:hypothetical protein